MERPDAVGALLAELSVDHQLRLVELIVLLRKAPARARASAIRRLKPSLQAEPADSDELAALIDELVAYLNAAIRRARRAD